MKSVSEIQGNILITAEHVRISIPTLELCWIDVGTAKTTYCPGVKLLNITYYRFFFPNTILAVKTVNPVDSFQCRVSMELIINVVL